MHSAYLRRLNMLQRRSFKSLARNKPRESCDAALKQHSFMPSFVCTRTLYTDTLTLTQSEAQRKSGTSGLGQARIPQLKVRRVRVLLSTFLLYSDHTDLDNRMRWHVERQLCSISECANCARVHVRPPSLV